MVENIGPTLAAERNARLTRWRKYTEDIKFAVWDLHHHRNLFSQMMDALHKVSGDQRYFIDHYWSIYRDSQMVALRRLVDQDPQTISMTRLLTELAEHPETMTRAVHLELWDITDDEDHWLQEANKVFDEYADGTGDNVDPQAVRRDLVQWKADTKPIKKWVDQHIAHFQAKPNAAAVGVSDLDEAIDKVAALIQKYSLLFTASSIGAFVPAIPGNWKLPFYKPLFPPPAAFAARENNPPQ
jgi:hypothetical protein